MTTAGVIRASGEWLYEIGLPAKKRHWWRYRDCVAGKGGLGTYSPLLDGAGNSVRGKLGRTLLSRALGLDLASQPGLIGGPAWVQESRPRSKAEPEPYLADFVRRKRLMRAASGRVLSQDSKISNSSMNTSGTTSSRPDRPRSGPASAAPCSRRAATVAPR